jgi:hypothetical protein
MQPGGGWGWWAVPRVPYSAHCWQAHTVPCVQSLLITFHLTVPALLPACLPACFRACLARAGGGSRASGRRSR